MATTKYNPHTGEWELVGSDWEYQYNPHTSEWKYAPPY